MKFFTSSISALLVCGWAGATQSAAAPPDPGPGHADVRIEDRGAQVLIDNGTIAAIVNKSGANVSSLKFNGAEMVDQAGRGAHIYFSMDGGTNYRQPSGCNFSVKTQSNDMIDVACKRIWKNEPQAFDIEIHFVLRRNDSGMYVYAILDHPAEYPATGYDEWRMVWRTPSQAEDWICVDDLRHWQMPAPEDYKTAQKMGIKEIVKLTRLQRIVNNESTVHLTTRDGRRIIR